MYPNISAFGKNKEKESLNNLQPNNSFSLVSICLVALGFKQDNLTIHENHMSVHLSSVRKTSVCPYCGRRIQHVHSYYSFISRHLKALT